MKLINLLFFALPFTISAVLTYLFSVHNLLAILSYFVFLTSVIAVFMFIVFLKYYTISGNYTLSIINRYTEYKVAAVIPTYNEDAKLVQDTTFSVQLVAKRRGDVYILDDSTDENIKKGIEELTKFGVHVLHRDTRRGYKAGAINDFLKLYGDRYDLIAIFDADQRPVNAFFNEVLKYFSDPEVAFIQVPQAYTELETGIAYGSYWQQLPFQRIIMRGREDSIFSIGSGTVFRIKALVDVGGLDENTVTEDIATSIDLHARGYKSIYVDKLLIWYGQPPKDLKSYLTQQSRWSLGGFQLLPKLLKANLKIGQFRDYLTGWMYWFKEGPLTLVEILAPVFFLLLNMLFIKIDLSLYLVAYMPYFFSSLLVFFIAVKEFYGYKGFIYHQTVELLSFSAVTASFIAWVLKRKKPFAVTSKKVGKVPLRVTFPHWITLLLLVISTIKGIHDLLTLSRTSQLWDATILNVFWAMYFIPFFIFGLFIVYRHYEEKQEIQLLKRVN